MNERTTDDLLAQSDGIDQIDPRREDRGPRHLNTDVVMRVAEAVGVDPLDLDEKLHDCIDPDALEAVVGSMDLGHVEFEMAGRRVHVMADGSVFVAEPD